ncbi:DinB family protein [Paenibacillus sp. GSMTC-2017]|uniref:DinB family protein n=1 Tax=Paenibacillus sp. GSMTC-2017 TaxID=2794350 RepID=UPI0018D87ED2|nr:DinB family protein [Paenibacillus sp. GSMTC-2017]MBH5318840.1 DinB family protein [Paenibacillus sp. GSMTC-2017]
MSEVKTIIDTFRSITTWSNQFNTLDDTAWFKPIEEGKASTAEIISHLMNWDQYLITYGIPAVQRGEGIVFPDFDPYNAIAYSYAKSGVSKSQLLVEFNATRLELCELLHEMGEETLRKPITANGDELCPHTGTPFSILSIIQDFIHHDTHHKNQIEEVLQTIVVHNSPV